jgi:pimeloyl-ACP methyl ester carboxylesterase
MIHVLYFNGLGHGKTRKREQLAFNYLAKRGIEVIHTPINWYAGESFDDIFARMLKMTKRKLKEHGKLVLVGSSAGGSMAVNILSRLHDKNLSAVTLCSRLQLADLPWWDTRSLERMAHLDSSQPSQAFFDSVAYCSNKAIPDLTTSDKKRLIIVQQWADFVVPRPTMSIDGVQIYKVPAFGHGWGIAMGVRRLPEIIKIIPARVI